MLAHRLLTVVVTILVSTGFALPAQAPAAGAVRAPIGSAIASAGGSAGPGVLNSLPPARLLDTRVGLGAARAPVAPRQELVISMFGRGGIPTTNVSAVRLTLTVVDPTRAGGIFVLPGGHDSRRITSVPFHPESTVSRLIVAPVGADGSIRLVNGSAGTVQLYADVAGYYRTDVTPPHPVTAVVVSPQSAGSMLLQWTNPPDPDFAGVMIRRSQGSVPPVSATDGTLVVDAATPRASYTDSGLLAGTEYSYALFAHDGASNDAAAAIGTATTNSNGPLRWGTPTRIDQDGGSLKSISCPTETFCRAVDLSGNMVQFDGTGWSRPKEINSTGYGLSGVSCPSVSFCVAVDWDGSAVVFDGVGWGTPVHVDDSGGGFVAVSCTSATFCLAVTLYGSAISFDGTTWGQPTIISSQDAAFPGVSCTSATFCVTVDGYGNALTFDGSNWTATAIGSGVNLVAISCTSSTFCVAFDGTGSALTFDGTAWSAPVSVDPNGGVSAVSCTSPTF